MTTNTKAACVATLTAKLAGITAELDEARNDVALLERLKGAEAKVKRLTKEQADALAEREAAYAARWKAAKDDRFKSLSDLKVLDCSPDEGVMRTNFAITYTRKAWDMDRQENVPQTHTITGFGGLPGEVLEYLVERHPEAIPTKIRALADDPREAMDVYFRALRRGYLGQ